jgi:hypothetical protein
LVLHIIFPGSRDRLLLNRGNLFEDCVPSCLLRAFPAMAEKIYFEFLAVLQDEGPTNFLIGVDKYDSVTGKESEDPELRAEDFIHLQHLAGVLKAEGPTRISKTMPKS